MKISLNWIKDFVNLDGVSIEELENRFILSVAEIENIEVKGKDVENCVAAKIIECKPHPKSDKLKVLLVDTKTEKVNVVCGAANAKEGLIVPFVRLGGKNLKVPKVESSQLLGITSNGVCCSGAEIGVSDDNSGIMILPENTPIGTDIKDILPIDDIIIEIDNKSLTHRPDLWGHYGIAREIAAITGRPLAPLSLENLNESLGKPNIKVTIDDKTKCFRYSCLAVDNVREKEASYTVKTRLYYCGMRSINLLVDLTNYVMLELSQPLHAFDRNLMPEVIVKNSLPGQKFTTLDKEERTLPSDTLMICNNKEGVAIAGIMGGLYSEVTDDTSSILLECANFDSSSVRKTALGLGLRTESSTRFEKALDPELTVIAAKRFIKILKEIDPGISIVSSLTDVYVYEYPKVTVSITKEYIDKYIGIQIDEERIIEILTSLEFGVEKRANELLVEVPSFRATKDISIKADIVEEVSRIYGYDNIAPVAYKSATKSVKINEFRALEHRIKEILSDGLGFSEIHSYVWFDDDLNRELGIEKRDGVKIINAVSTNSVLRDSMVPSMLYSSLLNKRYFDTFNIFEIGSTFGGLKADGLIDEHNKLCLLIADKNTHEDEQFYKLKGITKMLISTVKGQNILLTPIENPGSLPWVHPVKSGNICIGETDIGYISVLNHNIRENIDKKLNISFIEIDMDALNEIKKETTVFSEVSKYPGVSVDFTILVDEHEQFTTTKTNLDAIKSDLIKSISFVGSYKDDKIPAGKKSLTFNFLLASNSKTLLSEEIESTRKLILNSMAESGYPLR